VEDLMLREDVLEAVAAGKFHIWPVAKVEQASRYSRAQLAGRGNGAGKFEEGTVFALWTSAPQHGQDLKEFE